MRLCRAFLQYALHMTANDTLGSPYSSNAVVSVILVAVIYNAVRPVLIKSHLLTVTGKKKEQAA